MMFLMMRGMMGMPQSGSALAAGSTQTANDMIMGSRIAELKAEQESLNRQIAKLEARQTPLPP